MTAFTQRTPRVSAARRLTRRAGRDGARLFLAEGVQAVREALGRAGTVTELFGTADALARHADLARDAAARGVPVSEVTERGMAGLSETVTPQGLVAVCRFLDVPLDAVGNPRLVAVLAGVRDPGNAGTVLRTADAAGADAVLFPDGSVDPYNGKTVRSGAGSHFHLAVVRGGDPRAQLAELRNAGVRVLAATGSGEADLRDIDLGGPVAWLFGNEAQGLAEDLAATSDQRVRIPMYGRAESLNLAAAAAICLYVTAQAQRVRTIPH
jgi:RNA methyltransferase, TrmH family